MFIFAMINRNNKVYEKQIRFMVIGLCMLGVDELFFIFYESGRTGKGRTGSSRFFTKELISVGSQNWNRKDKNSIMPMVMKGNVRL